MYVHQITAAKPLHDPENVVSGHLIVVAGKSEEISKPVLVIKMLVGIGDPGNLCPLLVMEHTYGNLKSKIDAGLTSVQPLL